MVTRNRPGACCGWHISPFPFLLALASLALAMPAHAAVTVTHAYARATLPRQDTGVAYMTLQSPIADALTGASTPDADMAMLHQSTQAGGMAGMADIDSLALPAGKSVALAPNGTHIMLMALKHPLKPGDTLHLTLHFTHAADQDVTLPVRALGAGAP